VISRDTRQWFVFDKSMLPLGAAWSAGSSDSEGRIQIYMKYGLVIVPVLATLTACDGSKSPTNRQGPGVPCATTDTCPVPVGESCVGKTCITTAYCSAETTTCIAKGSAGAICTASYQCLAPLTCDTEKGYCTGHGELGSPCQATSDCDDTTACNLGSGVCAATVDCSRT